MFQQGPHIKRSWRSGRETRTRISSYSPHRDQWDLCILAPRYSLGLHPSALSIGEQRMKLEFAGAGLGAHRKIPEMTFYVWALEQERREGTNPTKARLEQT